MIPPSPPSNDQGSKNESEDVEDVSKDEEDGGYSEDIRFQVTVEEGDEAEGESEEGVGGM